jgi:hypothetical protein
MHQAQHPSAANPSYAFGLACLCLAVYVSDWTELSLHTQHMLTDDIVPCTSCPTAAQCECDVQSNGFAHRMKLDKKSVDDNRFAW